MKEYQQAVGDKSQLVLPFSITGAARYDCQRHHDELILIGVASTTMDYPCPAKCHSTFTTGLPIVV